MNTTRGDGSQRSIGSMPLLGTTKANFPALVHAFEYSGCDFDADTITDTVSDTVLSFASDALKDYGDAFQGATTGSISAADPLLAPEQVATLLIGIAPVNSTPKLFRYGSSGDFGVNMKAAGDYVTNHSVGSNYHDLTALVGFTGANSLDTGLAIGIDWVGNATTAHVYDSSGDATEVIDGGSGGAGIGAGIAQADLVQEVQFPSDETDTIRVTGFYIFHFTSGLPSKEEITKGLIWMAHNPHYIYPLWKGKA